MIKIKWQQGLIIASFSAITACGGGGGGGGGGGQSSTAIVSSASSMLSSSSQSSVNNLSPLAKIQFPRKDALTLPGYNYMTVSGVAYDDKGIRSVKVNGVVANLNSAQIVQSSDLPATHPHSTNWSVQLNLPVGDNSIIVDVTDSDGLEVKNAAEPLSIRNQHTPMGLVLDPLNDRMIGYINYGENYSVDLNTMSPVRLSSVTLENGVVLNKDSTEILSTKISNGFLKLYSNKIGTNISSIIANYELGFDPVKHLWIESGSAVMSADFKFYFAVVRYFTVQENGHNVVTKILKINTSSGVVSVLAEVDFHGNYGHAGSIFYINNSLLFVHPSYIGYDSTSEIKKFDPETGEQADFMSMPLFQLFATNDERTALYAVSYDKFAFINPADKTIVQKIFPKQGAELEITQLNRLLVDQKRNRLLVSNAGLHDGIAIDIASGELSKIIKNGIGDGAGLVWSHHPQITSDDKFAYVLDDRAQAKDTIFKIDLATGNRTVISDLGLYDNTGTYGLALDEQNNRIFFAMGLTIGIIDLATGEKTIVASPDVGLGIAMESFNSLGDILYDSQNNRLLVASGWQNGFIAVIDPITLRRSILFDSTMGTGPALISISAMALDSENKKLYVSNSDVEGKTSILVINIDTGDRTSLLEQCKDAFGSLHTLVDSYSTDIFLDKKKQQVYATSNNEIIVKDIAKDECHIIYAPHDDIALLSDSTLIGLSLGLEQIHPIDGTRAILSQ